MFEKLTEPEWFVLHHLRHCYGCHTLLCMSNLRRKGIEALKGNPLEHICRFEQGDLDPELAKALAHLKKLGFVESVGIYFFITPEGMDTHEYYQNHGRRDH